MSWIWGEKKPKENVKMDFAATTRRKETIDRTVKLHLELEVEYPERADIVQSLRATKISFDLPVGLKIKDTHLTHIELLGYSDAE
tara:strand:- start:208 stop:462 length:255 start_codon:yes stop_codon:yes gene_type:complete